MPILEMNEMKLYYKVQGEGQTLVFIHPPALTSVCFTHEVEALSQKCKTVLFDIRGHGKSEASKEPITYPLIASDIKKLLDHLGIQKVFLCGYSMGGSIVLEFLLRYPERSLGGILIGSVPEVRDLRLKTKMSVGAALSNAGTFKTLALALALSHADSARLFWDTFRDSLRCNVQNIRQYYQYGLQFNCTPQLSQISSPVLLVYGQKDKGFHGYSKLLKENLSESALVFVPGAGHRIPTFFSTELNAVIFAFVKRLSDGCRS
jgi:pimeloyl-ACP methyl ester carboxylesterase